MKIYQPMLYVGLGGTGCQIGAELERRLREEFCGPDGTEWQRTRAGGDFLPYELPAFVQFVYADLNEGELHRLARKVVPTAGHEQAVSRTQHLVHDLVPQFPTFPEVARSLRVNAGESVSDWLPPPYGEPKVAPLARGAGQLPTIGRATLMETIRLGLEPAQLPIRNAIGRLSTSGEALRDIGGRMQNQNSCDVFVAFSVAGGTGAGIFYDYLHLIGDAMARAGFRAQIYPLVLMPSAFDEGKGGGRPASLNAGRALLDLFRLIDNQNGQAAGQVVDDIDTVRSLSVHYPCNVDIALRPSTVQTGFLFSRTAGMERTDLHRSIVSLILSLVGTDTERPEGDARVGEREFLSFADEFINQAVERESVAPSGLGLCGVSTSLVASLTVPVDDMANIITWRMLNEAVDELSVPPPGSAEVNRDLIERTFALADVEPLRMRAPMEITELPTPAKGSDAVARWLNARVRTMQAALDALDRQLAEQVPLLAQAFNPRKAVEKLLTEVDLFRLRRIMFGNSQLHVSTDRPASVTPDQIGFVGLLENRRQEPKPPEGIGVNPPVLDIPRNGLFRRLHWGDKAVQDAIEEQNLWYEWRTKRSWHAAWRAQAPRWEKAVADLRDQLERLVDQALAPKVRDEAAQFSHRAQDLYRPRTGVSYLLPPEGHDLEPFYHAVVRSFRSFFGVSGRLRPTATVGEIVAEIFGERTWQQAFTSGVDFGADRTINTLRDKLKQEVLRRLRHRETGTRPLLPTLADLLAEAAGRDTGNVADDDLAQFRRKIAGLLPVGFEPQGTGPLKVLISYAAGGRHPDIERYLRSEIHLPGLADATVEFQSIDAESIVVVLFRTSMAVTEVPELRSVLRVWADTQQEARKNDYLPWRQRLGYNFDHLTSTEEDRVEILHRYLCAMWNDMVYVIEGDDTSPERIAVRLSESHQAEQHLTLSGFDRTSSWASLLGAYEFWTIKDDEAIRMAFSTQLMATLPHGLTTKPKAPGKLYRTIRDIAEKQKAELAELLRELPPDSRAHARTRYDFWTRTLPSALELPFHDVTHPIRGSLLKLEGAVGL